MNRKLKSLLIEKGVKQATIARIAGVTRSTVSGVLGGHAQSKRVKAVAAELLDISVDMLENLWEHKTV